MADMEFVVFNYIDDFMSIDTWTRAYKSFNTLGSLLHDLGVKEALDKSVAPTHIIELLGVMFDLIRLIICLPEEKIQEIQRILVKWQRKQYMTKKQLQSVAGKLQFAATCV